VLILDARVAENLIVASWTSMHTRGGSPSATYGRYLELISPWHAELHRTTPDSVRVLI
jgi:hypothetical protein